MENIKDFFDPRELNYNQLSPNDITQILEYMNYFLQPGATTTKFQKNS